MFPLPPLLTICFISMSGFLSQPYLPGAKIRIDCMLFQYIVAGSLVYLVLYTPPQNKHKYIKSKRGSLPLYKIFKPMELKEYDMEFSMEHFLVLVVFQ